jgi:hypothetical protein
MRSKRDFSVNKAAEILGSINKARLKDGYGEKVSESCHNTLSKLVEKVSETRTITSLFLNE